MTKSWLACAAMLACSSMALAQAPLTVLAEKHKGEMTLRVVSYKPWLAGKKAAAEADSSAADICAKTAASLGVQLLNAQAELKEGEEPACVPDSTGIRALTGGVSCDVKFNVVCLTTRQ